MSTTEPPITDNTESYTLGNSQTLGKVRLAGTTDKQIEKDSRGPRVGVPVGEPPASGLPLLCLKESGVKL